MKKLLLFFGTALLLLSCSSNSDEESTPEATKIEMAAGESNMVYKSNKFANGMLLNLCSQETNKNQNVTFSPLSMEYLLAMVANGASGSASSEIMSAMDLSEFTLANLNSYYQSLAVALPKADASVSLDLGNALWLQKSFTFKDAYVSSVKSVYGAEVSNVDFAQSEAVKQTIDTWCSKITNGMISKTSLNITTDMKFVLSNASYFKGSWTTPFDVKSTKQSSFANENGSTATVDMMNGTGDMAYCKESAYSAVKLPYGNGSFSMLLILPTNASDVNTLAKSLSWNDVNNKLKTTSVSLSLPKFKAASNWGSFADVLKSLGIKQILSADNNPLSNMSASPLYISQVVHDACLSVDEQGTTAAAFSGTSGITMGGPSVSLSFNRPFLFAIRENATGVILFMGKIAKL